MGSVLGRTMCTGLVIVLAGSVAGCKKDKAAAPAKQEAADVAGSAAPAAKVNEAPAAPAGSAANPCDLVGTLELRRITPKADCGNTPGRFDTLTLHIESTPEGTMIDDSRSPSLEGENVLAWLKDPKPTGSACSVTLDISDAGRTDTDETYTYTLDIAADGTVKGTLVHDGFTTDTAECKAESTVEGKLTRKAG